MDEKPIYVPALNIENNKNQTKYEKYSIQHFSFGCIWVYAVFVKMLVDNSQ